MYDEFFYKRLTELRMQKGVSAREMSLDIGQNAGYINNIENRKAFPSMSVFFFICEYLDISPREFFDETNPAPAEMRELIACAGKLDRSQLESVIRIVKELGKQP